MPIFTDSHCHLDQIEDPSSVLARAAQVGVHRIVAVSEGLDTIESVLSLARDYPDSVLPGVGLHPVSFLHTAEAEVSDYLERLPDLLENALVLGEVGLDYMHAKDDETRHRQQTFLESQFEAAAATGRPVNLHSRRAERPTLEAAIRFRKRTGLSAQMHWFTHSRKMVRIAAEADVHISVGPSLIDSEATARVVSEIPDHLLLLETDTPVPIGGIANHPSRVAEVAAVVALVKGWSIDKTSRQTEENLERFLAHSPSAG